MNAANSRSHFKKLLEQRLQRARLRMTVHGILVGLVLGGGGALGAIWTLGSIETAGLFVKIGLAVCCLAAVALSGYLALVRPWMWLRNARGLVRQFEQGGTFANTLVAAEEALRLPERWHQRPGISSVLVDRLLETAITDLGELRLGRLLPLRAAGRTLLGAGCIAGLLLTLVNIEPGLVDRGFWRLTHPWQRETIPATIGLYAEPGPGHVVAGQYAVVSALDFGVIGEGVVCEVRSGSGLWCQVDCLPTPRTNNRPYQRWEARIDNVRETFYFRFRRGLRNTVEREVEVWHSPLLTCLSGLVEFPAYTRLEPQSLPRIPGYLEVLAGSRLVLAGLANHPIQWAAAVSVAGDSLPLITDGETVAGEILVTEPLRFAVHLRDERGLANESPLEYELAVAQDMPPLARLQRPADDGRLPVDGEVFLLADGADDFGLSQMDLLIYREDRAQPRPTSSLTDRDWERSTVWRRESGAVGDGQLVIQNTELGRLQVRIAESAQGQDNLTIEQHLMLGTGDLDLVPGDVLAICVEVADNRRPGPPGKGRSAVLRLTLPSAAEILVAQAEQRAESETDLEQIRRRSRSLSEDLDRLNRELKKDPQPDWTRQQEIEQAIQRQQDLQAELSQVAQQLQDDLAALAENHLTSSELLQKMDQISDLLSQIQSTELQQLLERLREAVAQMSAKDVAEAVAEVTKNQKEMIQRLDSALNMLKESAREQELEGITSLLAQMIRKQQELAEASREQESQAGQPSEENESGEEGSQGQEEQSGEQSDQAETGDENEAGSDKQSSEDLAKRQQALSEELEQLQKQLAEALENLNQDLEQGQVTPSAEIMKQALEQALENLEQQQTSQNMQKASEQLQQGESGGAEQQQQQALRDLGYLYHVLLTGQQGMQMAMQEHQVASLRRLAADLLTLSERQEEIAARIPTELRGIRIEDLTRGQHRVLKAGRGVRDRLAPLTTSAPMQIIRLLQKIDDLLERLNASLNSLEACRGKQSRRYASEGLAQMNQIVIGLLTQAQMTGTGAGGGSSSSPQMSQQLKELARQQSGLNAMAEQLRQQMQNGRLSQETRSQMQRLQHGQGDLAGRVRDVAEAEREIQEGGRLLGDMDNLAGQMEEVVSDLDSGVLNEDTLIRQERILSRLLDAHNSVRKRDFSSRRESRTSDRLYTDQQGADGNGEDLSADTPFRLRYQPVEKAPLEYRDLVRRYFRALDALHDTAPAPTAREGQS